MTPSLHLPHSRRQAIKGGLGALIATGCATTPSASTLAGYIDAHSHIWTTDIQKFPLAKGVTLADLRPPRFTAEDLIELGKKHGVARHVIISHFPYHGFNNDYYIHAAKSCPGVFAIVGALDLTLPDISGRVRRNRALGITGYRISPQGDHQWLERETMQTFWRVAGQQRVAMCPLIDPEYVSTLAPMCERFPRTVVVIDHCSRIDKQHTAELDQLCQLLRRHRQVYVKVSAFYAFGDKRPPYLEQVPRILRLLDAAGPERLMWASDCPYQLATPNTYADSLALIRDRIDVLSASDKEWLLRKTAARVLFN